MCVFNNVLVYLFYINMNYKTIGYFIEAVLTSSFCLKN